MNQKYLKVKTHPDSKKEKIVKKSEDSFEIYVKEKAEKGLANSAVKKALSSLLNLPSNRIRLIRGSKTKNKLFQIG